MDNTIQPWPLAKRILFRFLFIYLILYIPTVAITETAIPGLTPLWKWMTTTAGSILYSKAYTNNIHPTGSGDTQFNYVCLFTNLLLALAGTIIWSILDRRRASYSSLSYWFRVFLRYWLGIMLLTYGMSKVIPQQFLPPSLYDLDRPLGESSPMGLAWKFFGYSVGYNVFMGLAEVIPGILLFFRRTTLLGALMAIGVMGHVFVLNLTYDIPVKQLSGHLLFLAIIIAAPECKRLWQFFTNQNFVQPSTLYTPVYTKRWQLYLFKGIKIFFLLLAAYVFLYRATTRGFSYKTKMAERSALYGIYEVKQADVAVDYYYINRWQKIYFDQGNTCVIISGDSSTFYFKNKVDSVRKTVSMIGPKMGSYDFKYTELPDNQLQLTAIINNSPVTLLLQRKALDQYPLMNMPFKWINEYPINQ
ncbi:hypothetical protein ACE38W_17315 [Chitinophaga sp. Hz27]|uniref:hypothetical protein n=1 Tax=Chitinophaga sp. Hz27 TaxID=3347169 RepID=UPI0035DB169B